MRIIHKVKCFYCNHVFDRDKEPAEKIDGKNRYAHAECAERAKGLLAKNEEDKQKLEEYIKNLFGYKALPEGVNKQIRQFVVEYNYSYSGILKSLIYFYEIKHGDKEKAYGRIGIVPFVYSDALNYYRALWEAQQANKTIIKEQGTERIIPVSEVRINSPQRNPMKKKRRLFSFLEEQEGN